MEAASALFRHVQEHRPDVYDCILKIVTPYRIDSIVKLLADHLEESVPDLQVFNECIQSVPLFCLLFVYLGRKKFPQPGDPFGIHLTCRLTRADTQGKLDSKHLQSTLQEEETQFNVDPAVLLAINQFRNQGHFFEMANKHDYATVHFENVSEHDMLRQLPDSCLLERGYPRNKGKGKDGRFGYLSTFQFIVLSDRNVVKVLYKSARGLQIILRNTNPFSAMSDIRYVVNKCGIVAFMFNAEALMQIQLLSEEWSVDARDKLFTLYYMCTSGTPLPLNRNGLAKNPNRTHVEITAFEAFKKNLATFVSKPTTQTFHVGEQSSLDNMFCGLQSLSGTGYKFALLPPTIE